MNSITKTARVAGLLYLLVAFTGAFSIMYVPSTLIVPGDAETTAVNILASEGLFRAGMMSGFVCRISFVFLAVALYRLFRDVDRTHALLMLALVIAAAPVAFLNMLNQAAALVVLRGGDSLSAFTTEQLQAIAMMFLNLHEQGIAAVGIFWGLWLFPFGVLVFKSGFLPRILGILLIISCFAYLAGSLTALLLPRYGDIVSQVTAAPAGLGEFAIMLWLVIRGARVSTAPPESPHPAH